MGPIKFANRRFGLGTLNVVSSGLNKQSIALPLPLFLVALHDLATPLDGIVMANV